jgi:hypothetical protein
MVTVVAIRRRLVHVVYLPAQLRIVRQTVAVSDPYAVIVLRSSSP